MIKEVYLKIHKFFTLNYKTSLILYIFYLFITIISILVILSPDIKKYEKIKSIALLISPTIAILVLNSSILNNRVSFILNLNSFFINNKDIKEAFKILDSCTKHYDYKNNKCKNKCKNNCEIKFKIEQNKEEILMYLTYFETLYILYKKKFLKTDIMHEMFSYRFFIAIHNPCVNEDILEKYNNHFKNLYILKEKLLNYIKKYEQDLDTENIYTFFKQKS